VQIRNQTLRPFGRAAPDNVSTTGANIHREKWVASEPNDLRKSDRGIMFVGGGGGENLNGSNYGHGSTAGQSLIPCSNVNVLPR
jgi:hypothetical protein